MKKQIYKFFWIICMIAVIMISSSFMIWDLSYDYLIFVIGILLLLIGIIGSIVTGTLKMIWEVIGRFFVIIFRI